MKQVVHHNLGTGIARLPQDFLIEIQTMLDDVQYATREHERQKNESMEGIFVPQNVSENAGLFSTAPEFRPNTLTNFNGNPFNSAQEFHKFLDVHTEVVRGAIDADLGYDVQEILRDEFSVKFKANRSIGVARSIGSRNELLYGDTTTFSNLCLIHSGKPPLLAKQVPTLIARAGQLASTKFLGQASKSIRNACLVNHYLNGTHVCGLHLDDEDDHDGNILMVHIGASRTFTMTSHRGRGAFTHQIEMHHGDAIATDSTFARKIWHGKLKDKFCEKEHFTLTYRHIYAQESMHSK